MRILEMNQPLVEVALTLNRKRLLQAAERVASLAKRWPHIIATA
jgi:hypothetical protein